MIIKLTNKLSKCQKYKKLTKKTLNVKNFYKALKNESNSEFRSRLLTPDVCH